METTNTLAHVAPTAAIEAAADKKLKIAGDVVNAATRELPDEQRSVIRWAHAYAAENDLSLEELGKLVRLSGTTLSLVFRGKYEAKLENVVSELASFKEITEKRAQGRKLNFIETAMTRKIFSLCDAAVEFQRVAFVFGDMQIGKTEALQEYQRTHNHGSTIYIAVPTGGALSHFLMKLAELLRITPNVTIANLRRRIIDSFDDRMLLIVDEIHRCIPKHGKSTMPLDTIEFIRELFDEKKCGVVLCGTSVFSEAMEKGAVERLLRQLKRRRLCSLRLPNTPQVRDLNTFAEAYGLEPAAGKALDLQTRMVEEEALGMWLTLLRMGAKIAAGKRSRFSWNHVIEAYSGLKILEG